MSVDSLDWSKQFVVFSISRLDVQHQLGFPHELVVALTDADMHKIAEQVRENYSSMEDDFSETVRFITSIILAEKGTDNRTGGRVE